MSNDKKETLASAPTLQKALALMTDQQREHHVHPNHIMLPLDADAKSILGGSLTLMALKGSVLSATSPILSCKGFTGHKHA